MSIPHPTTLAPLARLEYQTTRDIQAADWTDLISANNFRYRFDGCRAYSKEFDPAFTRPDSTTASTYSTTDASGNEDLDELSGVCVARRVLEDGGTDFYQWGLEVYGRYFDVEVELFREDPTAQTNILTLTASDSSGSWVWASDTGTTTPDQISENGNASTGDPQVLSWQYGARSSDSSNGASILQIRASASRISSASSYPEDFET